MSDSSGDFTGTQTPGTNINMAGSTVDDRLDALDVGLPCAVGASVGVRDLDAAGHFVFFHPNVPPCGGLPAPPFLSDYYSIKGAAWQERKKFSEFLILGLHVVSNSAIIVCGAFCAHLNL